MARSLKPETFEDFVQWLAEPGGIAQVNTTSPAPAPELLAAARSAWQEFQFLQRAQRDALATRIRAGSYREELELMAAADADPGRWLPRLRTPNGFAISALYAANSVPGTPPVGLLVECPADLVEILRGQRVHISAGGQWVEVGEIDVDGRATGELPEGFEFKPPFAFRVGEIAEEPENLEGPDESR